MQSKTLTQFHAHIAGPNSHGIWPSLWWISATLILSSRALSSRACQSSWLSWPTITPRSTALMHFQLATATCKAFSLLQSTSHNRSGIVRKSSLTPWLTAGDARLNGRHRCWPTRTAMVKSSTSPVSLSPTVLPAPGTRNRSFFRPWIGHGMLWSTPGYDGATTASRAPRSSQAFA